MQNLLEFTDRCTIQLSNQCNFAPRHPRCPAHHAKELQVLPGHIVRDVLCGLHSLRFGRDREKMIQWHIYNEPLMDPRLAMFTQMAKDLMPEVLIEIWTNGSYLTSHLLMELSWIGVGSWVLTAYSKPERQRLNAIARDNLLDDVRVKVQGGVGNEQLDNRIDPKRVVQQRRPCRAPLRTLPVYPTGHLGLCCWDTKQEIVFADLNKTPFLDALAANFEKMNTARSKLITCEPLFPPCHKCAGGR